MAIVLIVQTRNLQGTDILSSSNALAGFIYQKKSDVAYYFNLKGVNKELVDENARLRNELALLSYLDTFQDVIASIPEYKRDSTRVVDSVATIQDPNGEVQYKYVGKKEVIRYAEYQFVPARVVNSSFTNENINYITINRGSKDGVRKDMAVVTTNGIVGRVSNVTSNYATVVAVISSVASNSSNHSNNQLRVSAEFPDSIQTMISWKAGNPEYMVAEKLSMNANVNIGDPIYTTGHSYFPKNLTIGHVARLDTVETSNSKTAIIKLTTNFRKLNVVYVVTSDFDKERRNLEAQNESASK